MDDKFSNVKIVTIGEPFVGKTSLRRSFIGESFRENYIETIGADFSLKNIKIEPVTLLVSLWDLAGQEKFLKIHPLFYKGAYGCVVVYSVIERETFCKVEEWIDRFNKLSNRENVPVMIIGNKTDELKNHEDSISVDEEIDLVNKLKAKYPNRTFFAVRTSALTGKNVENGFLEFGNHVYDWIVSNMDKELKLTIEDDLDKNIPGCYLYVMNQMMGPVLIACDPTIDLSSKTHSFIANSGVKLIASLDFDDVTSNSSLISTFPFSRPEGIFHYIAFVIENEAARGGRELFIMGINVSRVLEEPLSGIRGVINGFLHNAMNLLNEVFVDNKLEYATIKIDTSVLNKEPIVLDVLVQLRSNVYESIKRWYNIPL